MDDPRLKLFPGAIYKARVTKVTEIDLEYEIEQCQDWKYRIARREVPIEFWEEAVTCRTFNLQVHLGQAMTPPTNGVR